MMAMGNWNPPIFFVLIVGALVVIGVPIAFAFGVMTLSYLVLVTDVPLFILVNPMDHGMSSLILLAIPLFIFLGLLIDVTGMAVALVNFLAALVGHFRGGLSYVPLAAMYLVSGISGAKAADMAAIAPVLLPEMKRRGYREGKTVALLASTSAMSETIPPSLILIMIGSVTGVSIAALFTGGLLPAAIGAVALAIAAFVRTRRDDRSGTARGSARLIWRTFLFAVPALILPVVIRAAVVNGIATATEVSTVGVVYTLIVGPLVYYKLQWSKQYPILSPRIPASGRQCLPGSGQDRSAAAALRIPRVPACPAWRRRHRRCLSRPRSRFPLAVTEATVRAGRRWIRRRPPLSLRGSIE
jgi:tripartite ATP-independent transporter DctM subunit